MISGEYISKYDILYQFVETMIELEQQPSHFWWEKATSIKEVRSRFDQLSNTSQEITVRGRIVAVRDHKRTVFADIQDDTGIVQIMIGKESVGENFIPQKGDMVGVRGVLIKSKMGELSVQSQDMKVLSSPGNLDLILADQPVLKEVAEIIENPERFRLIKRMSIYNSMLRRQMGEQGFLEFQTPVLKKLHEAGTARPFETWHNSLARPVYLRLTMESELRKLLAAGFERVFEFGQSFRNEGMDKSHLPEFSLLEAYVAYVSFPGILTLFSEGLNKTLVETSNLIDMPDPNLFDHLEVLRYPEIEEEVMEMARADNSDKSMAQKITSVIKKNIVPRIQPPTFLVYLPSNMSPFAKRLEENPDYSQRAWAIARGRTFCDLYEDEIDTRTLYENLVWQDNNLTKGEHISHKDNQLVALSRLGLPPSSSFGLSLNRLHMIINGLEDVRDTVIFAGS